MLEIFAAMMVRHYEGKIAALRRHGFRDMLLEKKLRLWKRQLYR